MPIFATFQENPLVLPVLMTFLLLQIKSVGRSREQEQGRAGNAPKANEGSKGVPVAYPAPRGVKTFLLKRLLSLSTRARATKHSRPPSHPHLLSDTSGLAAMPVAGAARGFALCHQQGKRDSSVLKMEVCRACFVAREKAGALSCGSDGTESLRSAAAGAEGSAAQRLYREGGRRT